MGTARALRAGNVWVAQSRRYANPETYLIPHTRWPALRPEVCQQIHAPADGARRLEQRGRELIELLPRVDRLLTRNGKVRMKRGGSSSRRLKRRNGQSVLSTWKTTSRHGCP